jgi:N-acetylmuramoyl-L-alanine amidase/Peptidase family M23
MGWPLPSDCEITTPYGKRGSYWSCNEDSKGNGVHTGVDFACPSGTKLYATIAGTIRHRNYGSAFGDRQFAISPSAGQPFEKGEVFYAHGNERLADGTEVQVGDYVGRSGARGNVSGPHLHYEFHADTKNVWNCSVHDDPGPTLGSGGEDGPYVTEHVYRSKCGYGEPTNGDSFSDTVKEIQERLNRTSLQGGQTLAVTGVYDADTDEEVRLWQEQICGDEPDPVGQSWLGPYQFAKMFPDTAYTLHDDGDPAVASGSPSTSTGTTLGTWLKAQGFDVDDSNVPLGRESMWRKVEFLMVHHTASPDNGKESDIAAYCRNGGAGTYPPLCQIMLGQSKKVWMTCQERGSQPDPGRASHAGSGKGFGVPDDTMNEVSLGIECQCDGSHPLSTHTDMYDELIDLLCALSNRYQVPIQNIIGHKEWSPTKSDPRDDMDEIRAAVEDVLLGSTEPPVVEPEPEPEPEPPVTTPPPGVELPESITFPLGIQYHYSGKPGGSFTFGGSKKKLDVASFVPKKNGLTLGMLYANVDGEGEFRTLLVRENPVDETAFQTHYAKGGDNYLLTHIWFESGEGGRPLHYEFYSMDGTTHTVTTRYAKFVTIPWDVTVVLENAVKVYEAANKTLSSAYSGLKGLLKAS